MQLYWQGNESRQRLILHPEDGEDVEVGAVRRTPRGYDALAKTMGYDPGRSQRGFATIEEAKTFVESFRPWEIFYDGEQELQVDPEVRPPSGSTANPSPGRPTDSSPASGGPTDSGAQGQRPQERWWEFWKGS